MKKIDNAIEKKMMESGAMGTETLTVKIQLTDEEKEGFLKFINYEKNYFWEFDGNTLIISYTEVGENSDKA